MANLTVDQLSVSGTVTASANIPLQDAGQAAPQTRRLNVPLLQILSSGRFLQALSSGIKLAAASVSITGSSQINTGLATCPFILISLGQNTSSGACWVSYSALASSGWFLARVWGVTATNDATPVASGAAAIVSWIAAGT